MEKKVTLTLELKQGSEIIKINKIKTKLPIPRNGDQVNILKGQYRVINVLFCYKTKSKKDRVAILLEEIIVPN